VEDLGQLVQTAGTQNSPERGQAAVPDSIKLRHRTVGPHQLFEIAFVSLCFGAKLHGSKFPDKKLSATKTNALLPVENGTGRSNSRDQHQQKHQWEPQRQRKQNASKIETGFPARHSKRWRCR